MEICENESLIHLLVKFQNDPSGNWVEQPVPDEFPRMGRQQKPSTPPMPVPVMK